MQSQVNGWMATAVTKGNFHEINLRDKVLIAFMIELFQANDGKLEKEQFASLPFIMFPIFAVKDVIINVVCLQSTSFCL